MSALPVAHLAHLVRLQVVGRTSHLRRSLTLKPNNRHTKCSANCSAVPLAQNRTIAPRPTRGRLNYEKPRFAGLFVCARVDSNHHGEQSPQGPQPCASTNSATGAGSGEYSPARRLLVGGPARLHRWEPPSVGAAVRLPRMGEEGVPQRCDQVAARQQKPPIACIRPRTALLYEHMFVSPFHPANQGTKRSWI